MAECAQHDPQNAFYDYLEAGKLLSGSSELRFIGSDWKYVVVDQEQSEAGWRAFRRGMEKPTIEMSDNGWQALLEFLDVSSVPATEIDDIVWCQDITYMPLHAMRGCYWRLRERASEAEEDDDLVAAWNDHQDLAQLLEQFVARDWRVNSHRRIHALESQLVDMIDFAEEYPDVISAGQATELRVRAEQVVSRKAYYQEVVRRLNARLGRNQYRSPLLLTTDQISVYVIDSLPEVFVLMLVLAIVLCLLGRCRCATSPSSETSRPVGWFGLTLAWLVALALTVVLLGSMPARWISESFNITFSRPSSWRSQYWYVFS